jgi:aminoglycoside phosphotransferase
VNFPVQIERFVSGWHAALAWESGPEARTWQLTSPDGELRYLKTRPADAAVPLRDEAARLRWASGAGLQVPDLLAACRTGSAEWLLTESIAGRNAIEPGLMGEPAVLVPLLADGLRRFHSVPSCDCPFRFEIDVALELVRQRVRDGLIDPDEMHEVHAHLSPAAALAELERLRPDDEDLVVCHGDYCLPNVLISDGQVSGFVDLGELGVADRWWDLAVGTWSISWNLGPGWEELFLTSYGVSRDDQRMAFYRLLYDLVS